MEHKGAKPINPTRKRYLSNTDIDDAINLYLEELNDMKDTVLIETVDARDALGRITAKPVFARISSPNHNAAAMDGIMVIAKRTYTASEANPVTLFLGEDFEYINTGHLIVEPYDSVIMIEDVVGLSEDKVTVTVQASPWQHIRPIGEDIVAGEMILPEKHKIRPMDIGAVLNGGVVEVDVYERIRIGIMPTGNEIVDKYDNLSLGQSFDTNSWTFKSIVNTWGGAAERISPVPDDYELLKTALTGLLERNHIVIINAGSSAGSKDYTADIIEELGKLYFHGLAIKPGKPTILGCVKEKPVIGVPGYPGSAFLAFEEIVGPVFRRLQRAKTAKSKTMTAVVSRRVVSSLQHREYIRIKLGKVGDKLIATPLQRGAGITMSLVKADGLLIVPQNSEGCEAGEKVRVELTKDIDIIKKTIVSIGSHDLIMDYIANLLEKMDDGTEETGFHLSSSHVGSMGGILALSRGEAHIAPIHLLDEVTGQYNTSYIERYLKNEKVTLIKGVKRQQGLIVAKGNPKDIYGIEDLIQKDISFVNRQKGSGTRILTDYLLKQASIRTNLISGYERDMTTHMAVAAAVKSGTADVGVGVYSAAHVMDLDFIPIGYEEYDFAVPKRYLETDMIKAFRKVLESKDFLDILSNLGGYDLAE